MQDRPSLAAILDLVIAQLNAPAPPEPARAKFEARVAGGALQLVRRALELAPASDTAERERLVALLGQEGELEALNRALCDRIRDGGLDLSSPGLAAHVRATTMEKLAIDQPTYAAYKRALQTPEETHGL